MRACSRYGANAHQSLQRRAGTEYLTPRGTCLRHPSKCSGLMSYKAALANVALGWRRLQCCKLAKKSSAASAKTLTICRVMYGRVSLAVVARPGGPGRINNVAVWETGFAALVQSCCSWCQGQGSCRPLKVLKGVVQHCYCQTLGSSWDDELSPPLAIVQLHV